MADSANIRIAKNTVIIYIRMAVTILVGLITSSLVLRAIGASDVGIYSTVGSTVALISVITGALSATTVRFMNIELGKPEGNPNRMFNICHVVHLGGAVLLLILLETIGLWYIHYKLNVPPGKEADAMFVFQVSTLVACLGIANVPFQSLFTVHERFRTVAIIDIINATVKLLLVFGLWFFLKGHEKGLRIYALMMSVTTFIAFVAYHILGSRRWKDIVRWAPVKGWKTYKEVLTFSNYNLLSSTALIARSQGSNMLINAFFGTTVNAAYYYAATVQNYVNQFISNFDTAAAPQITQGIGAGKADKSVALAQRVCRICILLFLLLFFPLWSELDFIMSLWLGNKMPEGTVLMCRWTLLVAAASATSAGLGQLINAYGRIKWYKISFSVLYLSCLLAGYLLFRAGYPAFTIIVAFVAADVLSRIVQLILLHYQFGFKVGRFLRKAYLRPTLVAAAMFGYLFLYSLAGLHGIPGILITLTATALAIYFVGLTGNERAKIWSFIVLKADNPRFPRIFSDSAVLRARYFQAFGRKLNLRHPETFNEKLQWMKIHDRDPRYTALSDKLKAKEIVGGIIGPQYIIPTLGVWQRFDDIDLNALPEQFVLKCTHDSGGLAICRDKASFDADAAREKIDAAMNRNFYQHSREWQYRDIKPQIIAEQYMQDGESRELKDYKFYCFDGKPAFLYISEGLENHSTAHISFVTMDWERAPFLRADYPGFETLPPKPETFDEMVSIAGKLSQGFRFVRVDLYEINGKVYFGELTFTPTGGFVPFEPDSADAEIGKLFRL
ncbi:MAG: hypothetical protein J5769_07055 [Bacteroidales bacterium]|nr:hypothetical protein [Bacteroidales bacterium]